MEYAFVCGHKEADNEITIPRIPMASMDAAGNVDRHDVTLYVCCDECRPFGPERYPHSCQVGHCDGHPTWLREAKLLRFKRT